MYIDKRALVEPYKYRGIGMRLERRLFIHHTRIYRDRESRVYT